MNRGIRHTATLLIVFIAAACLAQETSTAVKNPKDQAWSVLYAGLADSNVGKRTTAVRVLGLLPEDPKAKDAALTALKDEKPEVRAAAAQALGDMKAKDTTAQLYEMYSDKDAGVVIAAAHALVELGDNRGYNVYYAVLTGERKSGEGLMEEQKKMLNDPKKLAQFGFEQGIGFIPLRRLGLWGVQDGDQGHHLAGAGSLRADAGQGPRSQERTGAGQCCHREQKLDCARGCAQRHRIARRDIPSPVGRSWSAG